MYNRKIKSQQFKRLRQQAENQLESDVQHKKKPDSAILKLLHELNVHQIELEMQNDNLQKALQLFEDAQKRYQELYEFAPVGYLTLNKNNFIIQANLTCIQLFNTPRHRFLKMPFSRFISKNYQNLFYAHTKEVLESKIKQSCELELIKNDGIAFFAHIESIIAHDTEKSDDQFHISIVNISARKQMEQSLRISEEKFRSFIETTKELVWAIDTEGRYIYNNPSTQFTLGYSSKELFNRNRLALVHPDDRLEALKLLTSSIKKKCGWSGIVLRFRHKNGSYRYLESGAMPIINEKGKLVSYQGIDHDITDRIMLEDQLHQHQQKINKMARITSMSEISAALAHELTQPLTAINNFLTGSVKMLNAGNYQQHELVDIMQHSIQQAEYAGMIIHRMKDFMQKEKLYFESIDIYKIINIVFSFIKNELTGIVVKVYPQKNRELFILKADRIQIELVLLNLIRNSIEAMKKSEHNNHKKELSIHIKRLNAHSIKISLSDTGPGLKKETMEKIFEPYFTTKDNNLGMGLKISRRIIEAHHGQLSVKSKSERGACFEIILPNNPM